MRVLHVVKRVDGVRGGRYLLELEVKDEVNDQLLRLTHYIYTLLRYSKNSNTDFNYQESQPHLLLCNPVGFQWNPAATVHIIVPGMQTFNHAHFFLVLCGSAFCF